MRIKVVFASNTGNTQLLAEYAAARWAAAGHCCQLHQVGQDGGIFSWEAVDLLVVACATNYFRPAWIMERFVEEMPSAGGAVKPAVLLATCGGEPGAHFSLLTGLLLQKDFQVLGAHFVGFPDSWPPHRAAVRFVAWATPWARLVHQLGLRRPSPVAVLWPDAAEPTSRDQNRLNGFLDEVVARGERWFSGEHEGAVPLSDQGSSRARKLAFSTIGRWAPPSFWRHWTTLALDPGRCRRCGACVACCPTGALRRERDDEVPGLGAGCVRCWACFHHCPERALRGGWAVGRPEPYSGPSPQLRDLLRAPASGSSVD